MIPTRIFLDLDDVLNSFTMSALKEVGCPVEAYDFHAYKPEWGFDIMKAVNAFYLNRFMSKFEFWNRLNQDFWASVPLSLEFNWLVSACEKLVGRENICILTSHRATFFAPESGCIPGKLQWMETYLPSWLKEKYLIGHWKHFCAYPGSLLIDDSDENVNAFRRHGGQAILVPRPWNSNHSWYTTNYDLPVEVHLEWAFDDIFKEE